MLSIGQKTALACDGCGRRQSRPNVKNIKLECDHAPDLAVAALAVAVERTITEINVPRIVVTALSGTPVVRVVKFCKITSNKGLGKNGIFDTVNIAFQMIIAQSGKLTACRKEPPASL